VSAGGVEEESFGLIDIRSDSGTPSGGSTLPAVSIVTWWPADRRVVHSGPTSANRSGSPPVTTTCRGPQPFTAATTSAMVMLRPSGRHDVNGVSHHTQRRLQPLVRTNVLGVPASSPSPCSDG
jgi:hypothetical protein